MLCSHADLEPLLGFLPGGRAAQGGQAKRPAMGLRPLAHPVVRGHAAQRCEGIGADGQPAVVEPQRWSGLELLLERARQRAAHRLRGDGVEKGRTWGQRVVREPRGFAPRLARPQGPGIRAKVLDQRLTPGEGVATGAPCREGGARRGTARRRELAPPLGPGDQTGHVHAPRFGVDRGGSEARPQRVCARARDTAARGHTGGTCGLIVLAALAPMGHRVGASVHAGTRQPLRIQHGDGFVQRAAPVCAVRRWRAHPGHEAREHVRAGVACPGGGHRPRQTPHLPQAGGSLGALRVRGVARQDGHDRPAAQGDTDLEPPEQAMGTRRLAPGCALEHGGRVPAHHRESRHPGANRLRPRSLLETQGPSEDTEDTRDGAQADASHSPQLQGEEAQVHLALDGQSLALGLALAPTRLGLFACGGGAVTLGGAPRQLLAVVSMLLGSLGCCGRPLLAAVSDCGPLAHHALAGQATPPPATGAHAVRGPCPQRSARASA